MPVDMFYDIEIELIRQCYAPFPRWHNWQTEALLRSRRYQDQMILPLLSIQGIPSQKLDVLKWVGVFFREDRWARQLLTKAVDITNEIGGSEHSNTLTSIVNLVLRMGIRVVGMMRWSWERRCWRRVSDCLGGASRHVDGDEELRIDVSESRMLGCDEARRESAGSEDQIAWGGASRHVEEDDQSFENWNQGTEFLRECFHQRACGDVSGCMCEKYINIGISSIEKHIPLAHNNLVLSWHMFQISLLFRSEGNC